MRECILLGYANGVSKNTNKPWYCVNIATPYDNGFGTGYRCEAFYVDEITYGSALKHKPMEKVSCDIRFVSGHNFLLGIM